jgi:hypothetical protein
MSYATYLQNKIAAQKKVVNIRNPTDASMITQKRRFEANQIFFDDGQGKGTLLMDTTRPVGTPLLQHPAVTSTKKSTRPADASAYTAYRGGQGISTDAAYLTGQRKELLCCEAPEVDPTKYKTAADVTKDKLACDTSNALLRPARFVDTTIRLSAMVPDLVSGDGCCLPKANHDPSPGLPIGSQRQDYAITQHTFMAAPPCFQNQGVTGKRAGAYYNPRSGYVENKHGNDLKVNPRRVPAPFVLDPHAPAHLKINDPTFANVKPI